MSPRAQTRTATLIRCDHEDGFLLQGGAAASVSTASSQCRRAGVTPLASLLFAKRTSAHASSSDGASVDITLWVREGRAFRPADDRSFPGVLEAIDDSLEPCAAYPRDTNSRLSSIRFFHLWWYAVCLLAIRLCEFRLLLTRRGFTPR